MKILLTAFEPFDNNKVNFSNEVLNMVERSEGLEKLVLPVEYFVSFKMLKEKIKTFKPDVIILTGESRKSTLVAFEKAAFNKNGNKPDNKKLIPKSAEIVKNACESIQTSLDYKSFEKAFNATGNKVVESLFAGDYVCNAIYYQTLNYLKETGTNTKCVFIHIPNIRESSEIVKISQGINLYLKQKQF
jgi:pyroglutamyl-peptidase